MNQITFSDQARLQVTMTSLEIVDFINQHRKALGDNTVLSHADFMKKVPKVLGEKDAGNFSDIYFDAYGREQRCYIFPKREACLMAMSYSYELQAQIFDRMTTMEDVLKNQNKHTAIDLNDPHLLRRALLEYTDRNIELEAKNTGLERSIQTITQTSHGVKFQQACKILNIKRHVLAEWLRSHGWDRHLNDSRASTYYSQERGYCETKYSEVTRLNKCGELYSYTQIDFFILPKGMEVLAKHFGKGEAA